MTVEYNGEALVWAGYREVPPDLGKPQSSLPPPLKFCRQHFILTDFLALEVLGLYLDSNYIP